MNAHNLSESNAFSEGSQLWIIKNDPSLIWWKKIDLSSRYLLSQNELWVKKNRPERIEEILTATKIDVPVKKYSSNYLLLGTEDHFLNNWILLWNDLSSSEAVHLFEKIALNLKATSVRFFSDSSLIQQFETRPSASSMSISYIENI